MFNVWLVLLAQTVLVWLVMLQWKESWLQQQLPASATAWIIILTPALPLVRLAHHNAKPVSIVPLTAWLAMLLNSVLSMHLIFVTVFRTTMTLVLMFVSLVQVSVMSVLWFQPIVLRVLSFALWSTTHVLVSATITKIPQMAVVSSVAYSVNFALTLRLNALSATRTWIDSWVTSNVSARMVFIMMAPIQYAKRVHTIVRTVLHWRHAWVVYRQPIDF